MKADPLQTMREIAEGVSKTAVTDSWKHLVLASVSMKKAMIA